MPCDEEEEFVFGRDAVELYNAEYTPLEALLACIMDAHDVDFSTSRMKRIRDALRLLSDVDIERIDDPTEPISRGLYKMAELSYEDYLAQLSDSGVPPIMDYRPVSQLAVEAVAALGLPESNLEILRKKFTAKYGSDPKGRRISYEMMHLARLSAFYPDQERTMFADFQKVGEILSKYGIGMRLDNVFWRTLGNVSRKVPMT